MPIEELRELQSFLIDLQRRFKINDPQALERISIKSAREIAKKRRLGAQWPLCGKMIKCGKKN
jgi:hypothetical protein